MGENPESDLTLDVSDLSGIGIISVVEERRKMK